MGLNAKLTAIADAMREKTGKTGKLSLDDMAESVGEIFDAGKETGNKLGMEAFWNAYISDASLSDSANLFRGHGWGASNFFPVKDIRPIGSTRQMFEDFGHILGGVADEPLDLVSRLEECGVILDVSEATDAMYTFQRANISTLPVLDFRNSINLTSTFADSSVVSVEKLIVDSDNGWANTFKNVSNLVDLRIEGVINHRNPSFQWSTQLSHDSLVSIINALMNSPTAYPICTLTLGSENLAKLTADEIKIATDKGWNIA